MYHYFPRMYAFCTTTSQVCTLATPFTTRVYLQKLQKLKSSKEFVEITGYWVVSQLIHYLYPVTQPNNHTFVILKEVLGSHSTSRNNNSETLPISHPLLAPSICSLVVRIASEFLIFPFFLYQNPFHFPRIRLRG